MAKSLTRQTFGVPSQDLPELIETSDKVARLSEAGSAYETKLRELEHQFEVKASDLQEEYLAEVLEIHTAEEFGPRDWQRNRGLIQALDRVALDSFDKETLIRLIQVAAIERAAEDAK